MAPKIQDTFKLDIFKAVIVLRNIIMSVEAIMKAKKLVHLQLQIQLLAKTLHCLFQEVRPSTFTFVITEWQPLHVVAL